MNPPTLAAEALQRAAAALSALTPGQLEELAAGRGRLVFQPAPVPAPSSAPSTPPPASAPGSAAEPASGPPDAEVTAAVDAIGDLASPAEVAEFLRRARFRTAELREIAKQLGPTVSTAGRRRTELERNIVEGTAGFRTRSHAMSDGAWA